MKVRILARVITKMQELHQDSIATERDRKAEISTLTSSILFLTDSNLTEV